MISAKEVITLVKQGKSDPNWRIYRVRHNSREDGCIIPSAVVGFILLVFFLLALASGPSSLAWVFLLMAMSCITIAGIFAFIPQLTEPSFIVFLPKGVVLCYAGNPDNNSWLYYPSILRIELAYETEISGFDGDVSSRIDYWLDVYGTDGSYRKCEIDDCFGDTAYICKTIIASYNHYKRYTQFW